MTPSIESPPILSINVSLHTHCLHKGMLKEDKKDTSHSLLYFPHIHHTLESHLDVNSPLWSVTQIYLQNQQLRTLLDLTSFPSSIGHHCNTLRIIQQTIQEDLFSLFHQLQMPEFITDVERCVKEMTTITNLQTSPSASSSSLTTAIELAIQHAELGHKVQTSSTLYSIPIDAPLSRTHPDYQETCFKCHHLGHIHTNCQWYICPTCKVNQPGHLQHCCPLNHHIFCPSSSSSLSFSSHPCPVSPPHSCKMVPENSRPPHHLSHAPTPPQSPSPAEDFDYDDVTISNMTRFLVGSYAYF